MPPRAMDGFRRVAFRRKQGAEALGPEEAGEFFKECWETVSATETKVCLDAWTGFISKPKFFFFPDSILPFSFTRPKRL